MAKGIGELFQDVRGRIREVDVRGARDWLDREPRLLVLDVREPEELREGRLPRAHAVPRGVLEGKAAADSPARDPELADPARPVLVYCGSGVRSAFAADVLQALGFEDVRSLAGGIAAWREAGEALER